MEILCWIIVTGILHREIIYHLVIFPLKPTPMDSLTAVKCAPKSLQLVFKKNIRCNSIAPDGSDFIVTGTPAVSIISAQGNCSNGDSSNVINVTLSDAIVQPGKLPAYTCKRQ